MSDDPKRARGEVRAIAAASGHTVQDARLILQTLTDDGWVLSQEIRPASVGCSTSERRRQELTITATPLHAPPGWATLENVR